MVSRARSLRRYIVSLAVLGVSLFGGTRSILAGNTGVAPVLVPYTVTSIAGNTQSNSPGFGGEGGPATAATLSGASALAVDSVGNVYIADTNNTVIREINAQTGLIKIISGVAPSHCTGTSACTYISGCSDGVPAIGNPSGGSVQGLVIDASGNVFYSDYNNQGVWVIYHGGAQIAAFINLVDASGVTTAGGVKPGYVYHVAGIATPRTNGCTSTAGNVDKKLATQSSFHGPKQMGIDAAGNLYVQDFANSVARVINTQATSQVIFGVTVAAGNVAAVIGCNTNLTTTCPSSTPAFGGPATGAYFANRLSGLTSDQYGNVYELDTGGTGATSPLYAGVAYAGGSALAHLINLESGLTATAGGWYQVINSITSPNGTLQAATAVLANNTSNLVLRPTSIAVDPHGNLYMMDDNKLSIYRVDVNSQIATRLNGITATTGTITTPAFCSGTAGPQTNDFYGDGCPFQQAKLGMDYSGYATFDGVGNLYISDTANNILRKVSVNTQFPSTALGATVTQTLQVHFDPSNLPVTTGATPFPTTSFQISTTTPDFQVAGSPTCSNYTLALDASLECYVSVTFSPALTGNRTAALQATTTNGSVYTFPLTGFATGAQIAVDGGAPSTLSLTGLGQAAAVAVDPTGTVYVADSTNNRIVVSPAGGTQTTVGTGLSNPQGVAVDAAGNVYISDTGNNRILQVAPFGGAQTVLTTNVNKPQGLAVDTNGIVYVADTGNARILEISPFGELGAAPLLTYTGAQALITPVAVAVDRMGNLYVADSGNSTGIIKITGGGGDLQPVTGTTNLPPPASILGFRTGFVSTPTGVVIDGAGNLYVTDNTSNTVQEFPSATGPGSEPVTLNLPSLSSPNGLALDPNGNLYIADTGNSRILFDNRNQLTVNFGTVAQFQPPAHLPLTVTNIGTTPLTPVIPFASLTGATGDFTSTDTCAAANFGLGTLASGLHCSVTLGFLPVVNGPLSASESLQGTAQVAISGTGENPLVALSLAVTSPATGGPVYGSPAVLTATATQPHGSNTPSGSVTFTYTVNGIAQAPVTQTLAPNGQGGATTALTLNTLLPGRTYVITATYSGDTADSVTTSVPVTFSIPGVPLTVVANSVAYIYGDPVPSLTGTVTGILPADAAAITVSFTSAATSSTPIGPYPISVTLTGGNSANYTIPNAVTSAGAPAIVTESAAPLGVVVANVSSIYGFANVDYPTTSTGLKNGDKLTITYTPAQSSLLAVGTYTIAPAISSPSGTYDKINNYNLNVTQGTLTVTQAQSAVTVSTPPAAVLPTALAAGAITFMASHLVPGNVGTPTGTVMVQDVFTPLTASGSGTAVINPPITLTLAAGSATYTPTDPTLGTHVYTFAYSGDHNFAASTGALPATLVVDNPRLHHLLHHLARPDLPGVLPGGNPLLNPLEQAALPEIATVTIKPVLGSIEVVTLTCSTPVSYLNCTLTPASLTLDGKTAGTSVLAVSTPATLPVDFKAGLRPTSNRVAFAAVLPLGILILLPLVSARKRLAASRLLILFVGLALALGTGGCGGNLVKFFTPVPSGPQTVTVTATSGSFSRSFIVPVNIQ